MHWSWAPALIINCTFLNKALCTSFDLFNHSTPFEDSVLKQMYRLFSFPPFHGNLLTLIFVYLLLIYLPFLHIRIIMYYMLNTLG